MKTVSFHTIPDKKHTILAGFHTMRNKKHTKLSTPFAIPAALLIVVAQNNAVAVPRNKVPVTVETAQTLSYTVTESSVKKQGGNLPFVIIHVTFMRPDHYYMEFQDGNTPSVNDKIIVINGSAGTRYDVLHNTYDHFTILQNDFVHFGLPPMPNKPEHVSLNGKPALVYMETPTYNKGVHYIKQTFYDTITHKTLISTVTYSGQNVVGKQEVKIVYSNWKLNPKLPASVFVFTPPPGSKPTLDDNIPVTPAPSTNTPSFEVP